MSSLTEQIKERLDIVTYIQQYVPSVKKAGRTYKACCPFHGEKTPSFVINPDNQTWRCFGACSTGGDIFNFAEKMHGWSFSEALNELGRQAGVEVRKQTPAQAEQDKQQDRLRGMLKTAAEYYHTWLLANNAAAQPVLQYARQKRGFTDATLAEFQIGYAPNDWQTMLNTLKSLGYTETEVLAAGLASKNERGNVYDRFRQRLMLPIRDERGRVIGFGARALNPEDEPKYLNSPQSVVFDKSRTLFGLDKAKDAIRASGTAVIVEGYMDAIQAHQAGYRNVVAQMGTALTETQLKLLVPRYAQKIILALDADAAGQSATRRSLEVARQTLAEDYTGKLAADIRILQMGDTAKDPDDVLRETPEKWQGYVDAARPVADFVIDMETAVLSSGSTIQEREAIARRLLPILTVSEDNLYRQDNLQKLALRLRLQEQDLLAWADELKRIDAARRPKMTPERPKQDNTIEPPPFNDDGWESANSEEPPPFFPDDAEISPIDDEDMPLPVDLFPARTAKTPRLTAQHTNREMEAYGLRLLLIQPGLIYQVNRKLRELTQDDEMLTTGPLADFQPEDFSQSDFRSLAVLLFKALEQSDTDPLTFVQYHLEMELHHELETLLQPEETLLTNKLNGRMTGELADIWEKHQRQLRPNKAGNHEDIRRVLALRWLRLRRDKQDIYFLQVDAEQNRNTAELQQYMTHHRLLSQAWHRLNQLLSSPLLGLN